jgi:hypothetical protein
MTKILGISGKKQSGKTTTCNFLFGMELCENEKISWMRIDDEGRLVVPAYDDQKQIVDGYLDPLDNRPETQEMYAEIIWPFLKVYSFANPLKWICVNVLGLKPEQVNGTNVQKEEFTHIKWQDIPGMERSFDRASLTGREVLQVVGTDIFRRLYPQCWCYATLKQIEEEQPDFAVISDVRFPDEVEGIQEKGGKVIRFTKAPFAGQDEHRSETALDDYPLDKYDAVFKNDNMTIKQQNDAVVNILAEWKYRLYSRNFKEVTIP